MALTWLKIPPNPLLAKNEIAYFLNTDRTDANLRVIAHIYMELTPQAGNWQFVAKQHAFPDASGNAVIFLHGIADSILQYKDPVLTNAIVDAQVSRRIRLECFEYVPSDLEIVAELFSRNEGQKALIDDLRQGSNAQDYLVVIEGDSIGSFQIGAGYSYPAGITSPLALSDAYQMGADLRYEQVKMFTVPADHPLSIDDVVLPADSQVKIYKWNKPTTHLSDLRHVIKAGMNHFLFAEATRDAHYWVDENLDRVIDENGNIINT